MSKSEVIFIVAAVAVTVACTLLMIAPVLKWV